MTARFCITLDDVRSAAIRIQDSIIRTPVVSSPLINDLLHTEVFFKCENLQHIGAFKARGACNAVFSLTAEEAAAGVVTHSSGNHAAALARAASLRNIAAHIVMPHDSAAVKISAVRGFGVEPTFCEPTAESRQATAEQVMADTGATFVHPYNDAGVIAGQGTAAVELFEDVARLDAVIVPVGGGGLLSGSLVALKALKPGIKVFAAEPKWADDAFRSLVSGRIESPTRYDTIADGLRTPLGSLTFPIIQNLVDEILTVDEDSIRRATAAMLQMGKLLVEPSGAVPLAVLMQHGEPFRGQRVGVIVSGGNVDPQTLQEILREAALR
jgi:threonine dehydratase